MKVVSRLTTRIRRAEGAVSTILLESKPSPFIMHPSAYSDSANVARTERCHSPPQQQLTEPQTVPVTITLALLRPLLGDKKPPAWPLPHYYDCCNKEVTAAQGWVTLEAWRLMKPKRHLAEPIVTTNLVNPCKSHESKAARDSDSLIPRTGRFKAMTPACVRDQTRLTGFMPSPEGGTVH